MFIGVYYRSKLKYIYTINILWATQLLMEFRIGRDIFNIFILCTYQTLFKKAHTVASIIKYFIFDWNLGTSVNIQWFILLCFFYPSKVQHYYYYSSINAK